MSEGGAYIHNLITGSVFMMPEPNRFTPYFLAHSTDIAGLTTILGGDDRFYNNIFVGSGDKSDNYNKMKHGTEVYNNAKLPVWMSGNIYFWGAKPSDKEKNTIGSSGFNPGIKLVETGENVFLQISFNNSYIGNKVEIITTEKLGKAKVPKVLFENPDGTPVNIDKDYFGHSRSGENAVAGPFVDLGKGNLILKVW
jgi:hypothetical protein